MGVSAGRDSMALLHGLHALGFGKLVVCHLNHGLRGAAARADEALARRTAARLGLDFASETADTKTVARESGQSIETAARELRLAFFARCARTWRCKRVMLAHHRDDQVETILFNFLRGSGAAGLGGMRMVSTLGGMEVLRPLLGIRRAEIDAYVRENKVTYRDDASNADLAHTRNRLRHRVIPAIEESFGPAFAEAVLRAGEILREEEAWMAAQVPEVGARLRVKELRGMPLALQRRTVLAWLRAQAVRDAGYQETARVLSLLNDGSGPAKVNLPEGQHARRRAGEIFLEHP